MVVREIVGFLVISAIQVHGYLTIGTLTKSPENFLTVHTRTCRLPSFSALPRSKLGLHINSQESDSNEFFQGKEHYTDQEVEELVSRAEALWGKAWEARKLAEDLAERAEKLAEEIESKVVSSSTAPVC